MDARDHEYRTTMQGVKALYHSRHYTQCAKYAEQVLAETDEKVRGLTCSTCFTCFTCQ